VPEDAAAPKSASGNKCLFFKRTKLFQQRQASLLVKNTGKVALPFNLRIVASNMGPVDPEDADTFRLSQSAGVVLPGQTHEISVTFKPLSVDPVNHLLFCEFPHSAKPETVVELSGTSECPLIHFELPQSEYFNTRETDLPPADPTSCVVEFFSRGVNIRNTVRFMALNPTSLGYEFEWEEVGKKDGVSPFRCNTMRGTIHSGKKSDMVFEFSPDSLKLRESQWVLNIPGKARIPFLLVGHVSEPEVYFSQTKVSFGQVIVGAKSRQSVQIENRESIPYPFHFDALPQSASVSVTPMSGVVPPNGSLPVDIVFSPSGEEQYNYTLVCKIRKAITAMTCNVKGEGYVTHDSLRIQGEDGHATPLTHTGINEVSLGSVQVNAKIARKLILSNQGRFNLDYKWTFPPHPSLTLTPVIGTVMPNGDSMCELVYAPSKEATLSNHKISCKITNGHTYTLALSGAATVPNVALSWKNYDFGPVFLQSQGTEAASVVLTMTNRDRLPLAIDCLFDNKDYLEVDVSSFVLQPSEKRDIRVMFTPKECVTYSETINFTLNDLTTVSVTVQGEGTLPKVEVQTKAVRFGVCRVGERREVEVRVACKSKIPTAFDLSGMLPGELSRVGVVVAPENLFYLKPKEVKSIVFSFRPQHRMRPFQGDMKMRVAGQVLPFVTISGSCQGAEVHLDNKQVSFGPVVVGTRVTKRVTIMNTGDIGLDFTWAEKRLAPDFTMMPAAGFINAHSEQSCELTYHPTEVGRDGRREAVELRFSDAPSLALQIASASCVEKPVTTESVMFTCRVRETTTNKIAVKNDTSETWNLRPSIDNPVWSGPEHLVVRPRESADYTITYAPQMCTKLRSDASNDVGTVFFPLPTGTALVFRLEGIADLPAVAGPPIERDVIAKVPHNEKLIVSNWLKVPQRFTVTMKWNHDPNDESIVVKGVPSLDVPPNATREFKLFFSAYKEGKISGSIHFVNEDTKEYQFYNLVFNVKAPKEVAVIDLRTAARVRKTHEVNVSNPLPKAVTLTAKSDNPDVVVPPTISLAAKAVTKVPVEFFPLLAKDYPPARIVFSSPELGEFPYTVNAVATPPLPEKPIRMQCALGQCVSTTLRFTHYCKTATDFVFKFSDPKQASFIKSNGQMTIKVPPCTDARVGQEVPVDVTFEPCKIGDSRETVEISSVAGGIYSFVLQGTCTPPQRQGPFDVKPNQTAQLQFKNVFSENVTFQFSSDAPQFVVAKASEVIPSKKSTVIAVQYKPEDPNSILRAKLTVTGTPSGPDAQPISWVYYLRGLRESDVVETPAVVQPTKGGKK
jgi:hydrocephalus-inducing protein